MRRGSRGKLCVATISIRQDFVISCARYLGDVFFLLRPIVLQSHMAWCTCLGRDSHAHTHGPHCSRPLFSFHRPPLAPSPFHFFSSLPHSHKENACTDGISFTYDSVYAKSAVHCVCVVPNVLETVIRFYCSDFEVHFQITCASESEAHSKRAHIID